MRPAADRQPAVLEALETIVKVQNVTTAHLALLRQSEGGMTLETIAGTPATMLSDGTPLLHDATLPLHPRGSARMPRSLRNKQPSRRNQPPTPSSNHPKRSRNRSQTTPPLANSPQKRTLSPTPPSSSNTTNHPKRAFHPLPPPGAFMSSKARTFSTRYLYTNARAGCLGGRERWWISRLSIRVVASSTRCCSLGIRRRRMSGGRRRVE